MAELGTQILGLFSGIAQGYASRAQEERARKERNDVRAQDFTGKEKAQLDYYDSIVKDSTLPEQVRIDAEKNRQKMVGVGTPDDPLTQIDESGATQSILSKSEKEKEGVARTLRMLEAREKELGLKIKNAENQGKITSRAEKRLIIEQQKLDQRKKEFEDKQKDVDERSERLYLNEVYNRLPKKTKNNLVTGKSVEVVDESTPQYREYIQLENEFKDKYRDKNTKIKKTIPNLLPTN